MDDKTSHLDEDIQVEPLRQAVPGEEGWQGSAEIIAGDIKGALEGLSSCSDEWLLRKTNQLSSKSRLILQTNIPGIYTCHLYVCC